MRVKLLCGLRGAEISDGSMMAIDNIVVERQVADNMYQQSEPDYHICNAPIAPPI